MTRPNSTLFWMSAFLLLVGAVAVFVFAPLREAFMANAAFNGLIVGVLVVGIAVNFRQVLALYGEARWIENFRRRDPERPPEDAPKLLAPMARMLSQRERGALSLSTLSARSLLDSIRARLEESRDISRYLTGLLIFLGLLGTFWGLLATTGSVTQVIDGMEVGGADGALIFERLKEGLRGPLSGMGIAFSSSLFGLAGALALGFLDLQAGHAQNRFFGELEDWLSGVTRLSSGALGGGADTTLPAYVEALLEQTADGLERLQRAVGQGEAERRTSAEQMHSLTEQIGRLADHIEAESGRLRELADSQSELRPVLRRLADRSSDGGQLSDELRDELRLLNRTIAAALSNKHQG